MLPTVSAGHSPLPHEAFVRSKFKLQNVKALADLFPNSSHIKLIGLERASDLEVWEHAKSERLHPRIT